MQDDDVLFERLALEINQAGLSWLTVLKKREAFLAAFDGFQINKVAAYGEAERERLLNDAGIIRNRLKVKAVIENARRIIELQKSHGSFSDWLAAQHPLSNYEDDDLRHNDSFNEARDKISDELYDIYFDLDGANDRFLPVPGAWSKTTAMVRNVEPLPTPVAANSTRNRRKNGTKKSSGVAEVYALFM